MSIARIERISDSKPGSAELWDAELQALNSHAAEARSTADRAVMWTDSIGFDAQALAGSAMISNSCADCHYCWFYCPRCPYNRKIVRRLVR